MLTDRQIIEQAMPACCLAGSLNSLMRKCPEIVEKGGTLERLHKVLDSEWKGTLALEIDDDKREKLYRRLAKAIHKFVEYVNTEKMSHAKQVIMLTSWIEALHNEGGIVVPDNSEYCGAVIELMQEMNKLDGVLDGFDKLEDSAIKQANKLHKKVQEWGYY
ncbi:MAG: hypothetical protein VW683_10085 [Betaproteobacteria bacterium]